MNPSIDTTELHLFDLSTIGVSFHSLQQEDRPVLVIRFRGTYRIGCKGNPDARYMVAMGQAGLSAFDAPGLILDLSELDYRWGDMLESVLALRPPEPGFLGRLFGAGRTARAVVVGPACREAIGTLLFGCGSGRDACEAEDVFDDVGDALEYLRRRLQEDGKTPLHRAAAAGDESAVRDLIVSGGDLSATDDDGCTALHRASTAGVARILLEAGADPRARCSTVGLTPLHLAPDAETTRALIASGADPDARTSFGYSPLFHARTPEQIRALIGAGADVCVRSRTSLLHCVRDLDLARELLAAGAPVNVLNEDGQTPLDRVVGDHAQFALQAEQGGLEDGEVALRFGELARLLREHGARHGPCGPEAPDGSAVRLT